MSKKNVVGIDLGTSFSSIARLDQYGRPEVIPNAEGEQMTPSVIYFGEDGPVVGKEALKSGSDDPERLIENAKRSMGLPNAGWKINGSFVSPVDASAHILRKLRSEAEEQIGEIAGAVISVPVHFTIQQRELTILAAKRVGLKVLGLVNEPVAGALTFILGEQGLAYAALADEQTILVYDLGGGTFDLSIVHYSEEGIDVKAATGDTKLGGIDWNQRLVDVIAQEFWDKRGYDIRRDPKMMRKLAENIEDAKRSLSNPKKPFTNVSIRYEGYSESFKITREQFEAVSKDLVERTKELTEGLVRSTVRRWDLLNQVLPVGGATRMPMIREAIRQMCVKTMGEVFGLEPNYRLSPDLAIAQGAALYAGLLAGDGPAGTEWAKQTYVPKMVSSKGLGMAVRNRENERVNHILIPGRSRLPASVSVGVETIKPNQERISLKIVEAEDEKFRDEDVLLRCEINNLPAGLPEGSGFDVTLTCEPSGLLQVVAIHRATGRIATARLKRDMASVGEVVDSESAGTDITEEERPVQSAAPAVDPLFEPEPAKPAPAKPASKPTPVTKAAAKPQPSRPDPEDALFGDDPPAPAVPSHAKKDASFVAGALFEQATLATDADINVDAPQKADDATITDLFDDSEPELVDDLFDESKTNLKPEPIQKPAPQPIQKPKPIQKPEPVQELVPLEELDPVVLEVIEEEPIALELIDEGDALPLEVIEEFEPLEVIEEEEEPVKPPPSKLKPLSKQKQEKEPDRRSSRDEPPASKQKRLTPLSKRKSDDDDGPLSLD